MRQLFRIVACALLLLAMTPTDSWPQNRQAGQAPISTFSVAIDASRRDQFVDRLRSFFDHNEMAIRISQVDSDPNNVLIQAFRSDIKIIFTLYPFKTPPNMLIYEISTYYNTPDILENNPALADFLNNLKDELNKMPGATIKDIPDNK